MSLNKAMLLGNLGDDPELKYTNNQLAVCNLRVATHEYRKKDGESVKETEWHRVSVFGKQAENCAKYLSKGRQVFIEGRIKTRSWQDNDGNTRYTTEIIANNVEFIGASSGSEQPATARVPSNLGEGLPPAAPMPTPTPVSTIDPQTVKVTSLPGNQPLNLGEVLGNRSEENN